MKTLLLIDANSLIHRAFHALPPFTSPDGRPTGALYGLATILLKILNEQKPDYICAAFDRPEPTFREKEYKEYKATRPETAENLIPQLIESHNLLNVFNIRFFESPGWEADDIIMTLAKKLSREGIEVIIFSGDLDILQAVDGDKIVGQIPKTGISSTVLYNEQTVIDRFGVTPDQMADYKGLVGDKSDNIPGVRGVGPKTAALLINKFGSLEGIFENPDEAIKYSPSGSKKIIEHKEIALLSKKLAYLRDDAPIQAQLEELETKGLDIAKVKGYFLSLGFQSIVARLDKGYTNL